MTQDLAQLDGARDAARRGAWPNVYDLLDDAENRAAPAGRSLAPEDYELLADAAWWLSRVEESLAARQKAYSGYVAAGNTRRAAYNAWMLSTEYQYVGKPATSAGWLEKTRRLLRDEPDCEEQGYLAYAEAEAAEARGEIDAALVLARRMTQIGRRCASPDVVAMGIQLQGRLLIAQGRRDEGLALIDEVMCDVTAGDLSDLVTGWVYCTAVAICFDLADLRRAAEWNGAAMAWCESLPTATPFHGLCRVHHVELMSLGGAWGEANAEADRACAELMAYHPQMAAESFYVAGEVRRRMGNLEAAEEAYVRAHELGRDPQPGLALLRLAQGRPDAADGALRSCLSSSGWSALSRARLLAAQVEVALAVRDLDTARAASAELSANAESGAGLLAAMAATARGAVHVAEGEPEPALDGLRRARELWLDLGLPYEAARARVLLALASRAGGDHETALLELRAVRSVFGRLGSTADVRRVDELMGEEDRDLPGRLTVREIEVLRLVAAGKTNREIAGDLVISEHTVARHLNNIFAKLDVSSRAAATAFAYTHDLV